MKKLAILALAAGISFAASALPIVIPGTGQDIPKNGTGQNGGNGNSVADDFARLEAVIAAYNAANPGSPGARRRSVRCHAPDWFPR